jgi:pimeloyl-ACP methyl ester carboxylesterase
MESVETTIAIVISLLTLLPYIPSTNVLATHETIPVVSIDCDSYYFFSYHYCSSYTTTGDVPGLQVGQCGDEVSIYIHGWLESRESAIDKFNIVKDALGDNGYGEPVVGFHWTSNVYWYYAKVYADLSGERLSEFIRDLKIACEDTQLRLIGHSLGAQVILNALDHLRNDSLWNNRGYAISSVHLLGAAVDDEEISTRSSFGIAIQNEVDDFHNKFNPQDDMLERDYRVVEQDTALGENGADGNVPWPSTYHQEDVSNEISRDWDGDGVEENDDVNCGDNHNGYIGVVNANGLLTDDGAIDEVVSDWTGDTSRVAVSDCR